MVTKKSISEEQVEILNPDNLSVSLQKERSEVVEKTDLENRSLFALKENEGNYEATKLAEETAPAIQRRVSGKQRKLSLDEYRNAYLQVPKIEDRKPIFVSCKVRDRLDEYVRKLGGRKMSVSGLIENIVREHLKIYDSDFEQWRKL